MLLRDLEWVFESDDEDAHELSPEVQQILRIDNPDQWWGRGFVGDNLYSFRQDYEGEADYLYTLTESQKALVEAETMA